MASAPGPLGLILPRDMNNGQRDAHEAAIARLPKFSLPPIDVPKGTKIILTDAWSHPDVVGDIGEPFTGFGQYTGSCVGVSEGNVVTTELCVQRLIADAPIKAEVCWWGFAYGRTRYNEGDRGQGEGAVDSVMGDTLVKEGFMTITDTGVPAFAQKGPDGWWVPKSVELQWSDGGRISQASRDIAAKRIGMTKSVIDDVMGIRSSIVNGYAVLDGASMFVGNGSIVGSGDQAYTKGHYDGSGGHSTAFLGVWHHPNDGYLYLYSNQWQTTTYPKDPAGGGRCTVWLTEAEVGRLFNQLGGGGGETMSISSVPGQPLQPKVLDLWVP